MISTASPVLKRSHYLAVHDALKKLSPDCTVNAFVTDRHRFQVNMSGMLPRYNPRDGFTHFIPPLEKHLKFCQLEPMGRKVVVNFPDNARLSLTFGREGMNIEELHYMGDDDERQWHRPGLGADVEEFACSLNPLVRIATDACIEWAKKQFFPSCVPPPTFWGAICYRAHIEHECHQPHLIKDLATRQLFDQMSRPLCNPMLPMEDLNTLGPVVELCKFFGIPHRGKSQ